MAGAIVLMGALHLALIPTVGSGSDASALWFAGSGLFLVAAGLLNLAAARAGGSDPFLVYSTAALDLLGVGVALWAIRVAGGPPPYLLVVLFGSAAVLTITEGLSRP